MLSAALDGSIVKLYLPSECQAGNSESQQFDVDCCIQKVPGELPEIAWNISVKFPVFSTPIIATIKEGVVIALVINVKGDVFIFDYMDGGQLLWKQTVSANVFSSAILLPATEKEFSSYRVVFGAQDKRLHSLIISTTECNGTEPNTAYSNRLNPHLKDGRQLLCTWEWKVLHSENIFARPYVFCGDKTCTCHICQPESAAKHANTYHQKVNLKNENYLDQCDTEENSETNSSQFIASISTDGALYIICAKSGHILTQQNLGNNIFSSPVILNDRIIIGNRDNFLKCFRFNSS